MPAGRPSKYKSEYVEQTYKLCLLGATDKDLASFFDTSEQTINQWKKDHPEFLESIKKGKEIADANVASKLYHRAIGYEHPEDKIFNNNGEEMIVPTIKHYAPDPTAAIFWLKNRQPAKWRDKQEIESKNDSTITIKLEGDLKEWSK
jgi:DNA-binding XRE family transcriptional regulator